MRENIIKDLSEDIKAKIAKLEEYDILTVMELRSLEYKLSNNSLPDLLDLQTTVDKLGEVLLHDAYWGSTAKHPYQDIHKLYDRFAQAVHPLDDWTGSTLSEEEKQKIKEEVDLAFLQLWKADCKENRKYWSEVVIEEEYRD